MKQKIKLVSSIMWLMDMIQETMRELIIEWTLHNIIVFTVITSSSILSVFGALRHIYVFTQKIQAGKSGTPVPKAIVQKSKSDSCLSEQMNEDKLLNHYMTNSQHEKNSLVKDSMLYQKVLQKVKENIECLKTLQCECEAPVRRCLHSLCRRCCERQGWCRRKARESQSAVSGSGKSYLRRQQHCVQLSNQFLKEVPHRLGFHCMSATSINLSHNVISQLPEHMALIRQLQKINLSHNLLTDIPSFFSSFHRLSVLDLQHNGMTTFPETLLQLVSVQNLYLDYNELYEIPKEISKLQNLTHFGLGFNSIHTIPPTLFKIFGLRLLRLCGNSTLTSLPFEIGQALCLEVLDASNCGLESLPTSLGRCSILKHLILSNNRILHLPCEISHCCRLINLNVSNNPLSCLPATLHYRTSSLSLSALCPSFPTRPVHNRWILVDSLPAKAQLKSASSLFHLARVCVKQHDLDVSPLPVPLKDELSSFSSCFYCGCKATEWTLRLVRHSTFGDVQGQEYPFSFSFCVKHLQIGPEEFILSQLDSLLIPNL